MKIVHICLCGAMTDGFNYQENVITKYHRKLGYDVTIIASQWIWGTDGKLQKTERNNYLNADGVKMIRLHIKNGNVNNRLKIYTSLYESIEKEKPDILFIHDCQFLDITTIARYAKKHKNVRIYVDNHVDYSNGAHGWMSKNVLHRGLWRYCVKDIEPYVTTFYGVLPARVDFLKELYDIPAEKCKLLVMGADDELVEKTSSPIVKSRIRDKYQIKKEDFLIVTGGKIDKWKTQTLLLMQAVQANKSNIRLIVFGSVTSELKNQVAALADGYKIQYVGWMNSEQSYEIFAAADLVVFPGRHSVFWEQVAGQGIPMIVKDWQGTHHIDLGGNVIFLQNDSVDEMEKMIEEIHNNPKLYKMMKECAETKGKDYFSYSNIAKRSLE